MSLIWDVYQYQVELAGGGSATCRAAPRRVGDLVVMVTVVVACVTKNNGIGDTF